jgi:putative CocE/NonD family hydrolase
MPRFLLLSLLFVSSLARAAIPALPAAALDDDKAMDRAMPVLAEAALAAQREGEDRGAYLNDRFRLQMVAGRHPEALDSLHAWRAHQAAKGLPSASGFVQYEIVLAAQRDAAAGKAIDAAFEQAFGSVYGGLDDLTAGEARFSFGAYLPGFEAELRRQLDASRGQRELTQAQAVALVRAYQVHRAYALLLPRVPSALAADDARRYVQEEVRVAVPDGSQVVALVVRPRKAAAALPTLMNFSIYADRDGKLDDLRYSAARGYAGVAAFSRGKLGSPDPIVPYEAEGSAAVAVIDWISRQAWSDGRVGMYGGSYEGYTQWAAAKIGHPALRAIMPSVPVMPGNDVPMEGGIFQSFVYRWIPHVTRNDTMDHEVNNDHARWQALDREAYRSGRAYRDLPTIDGQANPLFDRWMQHPTYDAYWQAMTPQGREFARIDIPVLTTTGYYDGCLLSAVHYFQQHTRYNPRADHTLVVGPYDHLSGQFRSGPELLGYALDPSAAMDMRALRYAWYDHQFKGAQRPALLKDRVNYQVMGADTWRHAPTLEAMGPERRIFHFGAARDDGRYGLVTVRDRAASAIPLRVDLADRSDADREFSSLILSPTLDAANAIVLATEPMAAATEFSGLFSAHLDFSTNKRDFDLSLSLYEQLADGRYLQLSYVMARASQLQDPSRRKLLTPGKRYRWDVPARRLAGRQLAPGSRLVAVLGVVKSPGAQVNLGSGKPVAEETVADAGEPLEILWHPGSRLEIPVRP